MTDPRHGQGRHPVRRPNIILMMTDDHAVPAIGAYGSVINRTPAVDRLAAEGMRFDNAFVRTRSARPPVRRSSPARTAMCTA